MELTELEVNEDERGWFVETFKLPTDGQLSYVIGEPNEVRGNHYHLRKTEHFVVVAGTAKIQTRDRSNGNLMTVEVTGYRPMVVTIHPNTTHAITPLDRAVIMVWCDEQFNADDSDTFSEEI